MRPMSTVVLLARYSLEVFALLLVSNAAQAGNSSQPSGDWQVRKSIPAGTKIKITLKHHRTFGHCKLENVTDDWLGCSFTSSRCRQYRREEIREVRLGHHSARTGFFIGAGVGAIAGAANGSAGGAGCVFDVIVFVPLLGVVGAGVGVVVDPFLHGKTVYRSPDFSAPPTVARP
jgi:hypothetical protein